MSEKALLTVNQAVAANRSGGKLIPQDGTPVSAVPSVVTSKLDYNARAAATGAPAEVHGPLATTRVHTAFGSYVKCVVDGWDVDPATIRTQPEETEPRPVSNAEVKADGQPRDERGRWADGDSDADGNTVTVHDPAELGFLSSRDHAGRIGDLRFRPGGESDRRVQAIRRSIRAEGGLREPVRVGGAGGKRYLADGHHRYVAARDEGVPVPVVGMYEPLKGGMTKARLTVGQPVEGSLAVRDPRRAAAALAEGHDVTVPTAAHAEQVRRLLASKPDRLASNPDRLAGNAAEAKDWNEDDHPRDDRGRFSDSGGSGGSGHVIDASGGMHTAVDFEPYIGRTVTISKGAGTAQDPKKTFTGKLTGIGPGVVQFHDGLTMRTEMDMDRRGFPYDKTEEHEPSSWNNVVVGDMPLTAAQADGPPVTARPDDRVYTGKYPEVDAAIKDARSILLRQGPPTADEIAARAGFYCATGEYLQREMNSGLYSAWQMGQSGQTVQQWAAAGFRNWYTSESRRSPMMAAYGGAAYADRLANVIAKAKDAAADDVSALRWPAAKDGNQEASLRFAQAVLSAGFRNRDSIPLANQVAAYLTDAGKAIAAGAEPAAPDPALIHELRQGGYRAQSLATYKADPNAATAEQLGETQIANMVKEGVNIPAMLPTGRAILAEQAIRQVGAKIDAAVDAKTAGLADQEGRTRQAMQATRLALASRENNVRLARSVTQSILDRVRLGAGHPTDPAIKFGLSPSQREQLEESLPKAADRGSGYMRTIVAAVVPYGEVRDAVLAKVDAQAKKLDGYASQIGKADKVIGEHGIDAYQSDVLVKERRDATAAVLADIRPMGDYSDWSHGVLPGGAKISGATSGQMLAAVAATRFPQDWLDKAAEGPPIKLQDTSGRASWNDTDNVLTWRGGEPPIQGDPPGGDVMIHEMAHMMESRVPGITEVEHAHWWQRTANEPTVRLRDVVGRGYDEREVCRPDKFFDPYAGKSYGTGPDSHFELLSTGTQAVAGGAFGGLRGIGVNRLADDDPITRRAPLNAPDDDLRHFTLGTLATI